MRFLFVFFFLFLSVNIRAADYVRVVFEEITIKWSEVSASLEDKTYPRIVVDFNNIGSAGDNTEIQEIGDESFLVYLGSSSVNIRRNHLLRANIFLSNPLDIATTNGQTLSFDIVNYPNDGPQVITYTYRGDTFPELSIGEGPFDEDDKDYVQVKHIDLDQDKLIGFKELYVKGAESGENTSRSIYFSDDNGDGNADTGELFADSSGLEELPQSAEDIPIRASLGDTDGDGVDEGEDEDDSGEGGEDEGKTLDDYMPGLAEFKQNLGIDGLSIPTEKDIDFEFNINGQSYGYQGVQSDPILNSARLGIKALLSLYFTFMFLRSIVTTVRQW
jgi:hypothetical protein